MEAAWICYNETIARKHYLRVTEDHFKRAVSVTGEAVRNPVRQLHETTRNEQKQETGPTKQTRYVPYVAPRCRETSLLAIPPRGVEPLYAD